MKFSLSGLVLLAALSGCANLQQNAAPAKGSAPTESVSSAPTRGPVLGTGRSAAAFDRTTAAEKQAALAVKATAGERSLGKVAVSLGSPTEQGIWLKSALVKSPTKGRIQTAGGKSAAVDLLPGAGAAQLSLAAYLALGLALTELPEVTVFAN